jgi:tRNA pseudouridine55 synthase
MSFNGVVLVNKDSGPTSHDVVNMLRKILNMKKIGHTGTLDPMASGLLIMCLGTATKASNEISSKNKRYLAEIELGYETDTLDAQGQIVKRSSKHIEMSEVRKVIENLKDIKSQIPPRFSAIKVNGIKAYKQARKDISFDMPSKDIEIFESNLISYIDNIIKVDLLVSKGTYIRSIARDIGYALGSYGTLVSLVRTEIGNYSIENSYTIEDIKVSFENKNTNFII